jgi:hypothetical protein
MAKVFGVHEIELRPGVTAEEFERFLAQEYAPAEAPPPAGLKVYHLKGDRGERAGKYLVLIEIDSVETRDHYFPAPGELSAAAQQYFDQRSESQQALDAKMDTLVTPVGEIYTDYVVIAG